MIDKPLWQSKTLWFNGAVAALAAAEEAAHFVEPVIPGNAYAWGIFLLAVGNAVLRVISARQARRARRVETPPPGYLQCDTPGALPPGVWTEASNLMSGDARREVGAPPELWERSNHD
jgi:hypothetical protein